MKSYDEEKREMTIRSTTQKRDSERKNGGEIEVAEEEKERGEKQEEEGSGREDWGRVGGGLGED